MLFQSCSYSPARTTRWNRNVKKERSPECKWLLLLPHAIQPSMSYYSLKLRGKICAVVSFVFTLVYALFIFRFTCSAWLSKLSFNLVSWCFYSNSSNLSGSRNHVHILSIVNTRFSTSLLYSTLPTYSTSSSHPLARFDFIIFRKLELLCGIQETEFWSVACEGAVALDSLILTSFRNIFLDPVAFS